MTPEEFDTTVLRVDGCRACNREIHAKHKDAPVVSPVLWCRACEKPTRHTFSGYGSRAAIHGPVGVYYDHLYRCSCTQERAFGTQHDRPSHFEGPVMS